jgi:hypothetical protein
LQYPFHAFHMTYGLDSQGVMIQFE